MSWSGNDKDSNLFAALDGTGENLILSLNSYSCPGATICAMAFDVMGNPLLSPDMHVYTTGGMKVSYTNSVMGGYVESMPLPADTYNVDLTGTQTFISETGWSLGYNSASAESLAPIQLRAKDIYGNEEINGEVWLRRGDSVDWMGWLEDHSSLSVYATPGTYDIYIQEWYYRDYALLKEDYVHSSGAIVTLDASTMPVDAVTYNWDGPTWWGYAIIPIFDTYISYLGTIPDGHTIIVSNPDSSYTLGAEPTLVDGTDVWYYSFYDCCPVAGPGASVAYTIGGALTTDLAVIGDPYTEGGTGYLETTVEDAHGNVLGAIDLEDDDGILSMSFSSSRDTQVDKVYPGHRDLIDTRPTAIEKTETSSIFDSSLEGSFWYSFLPVYTVEDALSTPIPGAWAGSYFTAPYEFDIPDPANTGTWSGSVLVEFGPYQVDGTDTVTFEVKASNVIADFNGDGDTDFSYYRPSNGYWYYSDDGTPSWTWFGGEPTDIIVPGDYNGDGDTDFAYYRPSNGYWYVYDDGSPSYTWWGAAPTDILVPGDYNGDGDTDFAYYRPSTGFWYVKDDGVGSWTWWGAAPTDILVPGDYNGDGDTDLAYYRPSNGFWYVMDDGVPSWTWWGAAPTDIVVPGDFNGDGDTDLAYYRPSNGFWYVKDDGSPSWEWWGAAPTDVLVPGDYNGDGDTDLAYYRPSNGFWYVKDDGSPILVVVWIDT